MSRSDCPSCHQQVDLDGHMALSCENDAQVQKLLNEISFIQQCRLEESERLKKMSKELDDLRHAVQEGQTENASKAEYWKYRASRYERAMKRARGYASLGGYSGLSETKYAEALTGVRRELEIGLSGVSEWQSIETAPKDGTRVLLHSPENKGAEIGYWWTTGQA